MPKGCDVRRFAVFPRRAAADSTMGSKSRTEWAAERRRAPTLRSRGLPAAGRRAYTLAIAAMGSKSRTDRAAAGEEHPHQGAADSRLYGEEHTHWQLQPWGVKAALTGLRRAKSIRTGNCSHGSKSRTDRAAAGENTRGYGLAERRRASALNELWSPSFMAKSTRTGNCSHGE